MSARILLADDHEIARTGMRNLLNGHRSWEVCGEAENGLEAVEKVLQLKPDLVILDLSMPIMNGIEAAREIRRRAPATKIVIFSMHDAPQIKEEALKAGADRYLAKTVHFAEFEAAIADLFDNNPSR